MFTQFVAKTTAQSTHNPVSLWDAWLLVWDHVTMVMCLHYYVHPKAEYLTMGYVNVPEVIERLPMFISFSYFCVY